MSEQNHGNIYFNDLSYWLKIMFSWMPSTLQGETSEESAFLSDLSVMSEQSGSPTIKYPSWSPKQLCANNTDMQLP